MYLKKFSCDQRANIVAAIGCGADVVGATMAVWWPLSVRRRISRTQSSRAQWYTPRSASSISTVAIAVHRIDRELLDRPVRTRDTCGRSGTRCVSATALRTAGAVALAVEDQGEAMEQRSGEERRCWAAPGIAFQARHDLFFEHLEQPRIDRRVTRKNGWPSMALTQ